MSIVKSFPSAADLDLDMWRAGHVDHRGHRDIGCGPDTDAFCLVLKLSKNDDAMRDATARRIETLGDLYDSLRELADRARTAGLDVEQAVRVLQEIVAPKPYAKE